MNAPPPPPGWSATETSTKAKSPRLVLWLGGVALVLAGVLVGVVASSLGDSAGPPERSAAEADTEGEEAPGSGATSGEAAAEEAAAVLFGPEEFEVELSGGNYYLDLDSAPPLVAETRTGGHDMIFSTTTGTGDVASKGSTAFTLAPLPEGGAVPDRRECADHVETNGTYRGGLANGARFCLQTDEGRMAYFEVLGAPVGRGPVTLDLTVWE